MTPEDQRLKSVTRPPRTTHVTCHKVHIVPLSIHRNRGHTFKLLCDSDSLDSSKSETCQHRNVRVLQVLTGAIQRYTKAICSFDISYYRCHHCERTSQATAILQSSADSFQLTSLIYPARRSRCLGDIFVRPVVFAYSITHDVLAKVFLAARMFS